MDLAGLKKTPLYPVHEKYGAKIVEFGGWAMPVQFSGILEEHRAVRTAAGLFDVSHMGEFMAEGPGALAFIQHLITNDAARLADGQALYSLMCYENGTVVDDLLVYRYGQESYMLVVNAGNAAKDWDWARARAAGFAVVLTDVSDATGLLAVQGPRARGILQALTRTDLDAIGYYHFARGQVAGCPLTISRTGYTGEDGFELYCRAGDAILLWEEILAAGAGAGLIPCGLGARDTLRFEARLPLYGHELNAQTTPLEAGLGLFVKLNKGVDFAGRAALAAQKQAGVKKRLVGFEMVERGIARQGYPITRDGREVGVVTTGSPSPTLGKNLGLAFVPPDLAVVGTEFEVLVRGRGVKARVIPTPFYRRPE